MWAEAIPKFKVTTNHCLYLININQEVKYLGKPSAHLEKVWEYDGSSKMNTTSSLLKKWGALRLIEGDLFFLFSPLANIPSMPPITYYYVFNPPRHFVNILSNWQLPQLHTLKKVFLPKECLWYLFLALYGEKIWNSTPTIRLKL